MEVKLMINADKVQKWKKDVEQSVDLYNSWFLNFAPSTYKETRIKTTKFVEQSLLNLNDMKNINPEFLYNNPKIVEVLRMCTAPPIASDRLLGLSGLAKTSSNFIKSMEKNGKVPPKKPKEEVMESLNAICNTISNLLDTDIFSWINNGNTPTKEERYRASTIVADRLCGAVANPIIRNAQEKRQLKKIEEFMINLGYSKTTKERYQEMEPGTYAFTMNVPGKNPSGNNVNIPVDVLIKRKNSKKTDLPILIECKSAGDFANTNKRRKEESQKHSNLKRAYGEANVEFLLFLCGYFDTPYLGYEAAEGIDWIWEHRIEDMNKLNL